MVEAWLPPQSVDRYDGDDHFAEPKAVRLVPELRSIAVHRLCFIILLLYLGDDVFYVTLRLLSILLCGPIVPLEYSLLLNQFFIPDH